MNPDKVVISLSIKVRREGVRQSKSCGYHVSIAWIQEAPEGPDEADDPRPPHSGRGRTGKNNINIALASSSYDGI